MGIIVSSMNGCGRTWLKSEYRQKAKFLDMSSQPLDSPEKLDEIVGRVGSYDIVFVDASKETIDMLCDNNVDFDLFYPSRERNNEIVESLVVKRWKSADIQKFDNDFHDTVDYIESIDDEHCFKHELKKGQFIGNNVAIINYLNSLGKNE